MRAAANIFPVPTSTFTGGALCAVRWNVLLAPIIHRLFPASAQNRFRAVVAVRIAPVEGPLVVQLPYILSQRHGSGNDPRAVLGSLAASGWVCIATTCGS